MSWRRSAPSPRRAPRPARRRSPSRRRAKAEPLDPAAEAWIQMLAKKIADSQPLVRDSAVAGARESRQARAADAERARERLRQGSRGGREEARRADQSRPAAGPAAWPVPATWRAHRQLAKELKLDEKKTQKLKDLQKALTRQDARGLRSRAAGDLTREEAREEMKQIPRGHEEGAAQVPERGRGQEGRRVAPRAAWAAGWGRRAVVRAAVKAAAARAVVVRGGGQDGEAVGQ